LRKLAAGAVVADIIVVFGTRPEAIKMAPVVMALRNAGRFTVKVCVTAQHRELLDSVLRLFDIAPDVDLNIMKPDQSLDELTAGVVTRLGAILDHTRPRLVMVHGDTTTTMAAALSAFYRRIPVGHVEAGLRSRNMFAPWPEELNRRVASLTTRFHFAPTAQARSNLLAEGFPHEHIHVTGNTVIDALQWVAARIEASPERSKFFADMFRYLDPRRRLVLVTGHRRENFGDGFVSICRAIRRLVARADIEVIYPVHPNPNVRGVIDSDLRGVERVHLIDPLDYEPFVYLMRRASVLLTDSGGVQEEGPSLGKPVLVMREVTERPEAVEAGTVRLVGSDADRIVAEVERLLDDRAAYEAMARAINPYGDGLAARRISAVLEQEL
jgi:UDP-N-acetylglucosamine 2-epimerase (non-hydrolysing)